MPPAELLESISSTAHGYKPVPAEVEEDFVLAPPPERPQLRLDFATAPDNSHQRLLMSGEAAVFVRKRKENCVLFTTAVMEKSGEEKTFSHPPAKVTLLG